AWGLVVAADLGTSDRLEVEMLEGMAPGEPEALRRMGFPVRLYAPVVPDGQRESASAYLVRRLDENSGTDNYLRHSLAHDLTTPRQELRSSVGGTVSFESRRGPGPLGRGFSNAADTDWALRANRVRMAHSLSSPVSVGAPRSADTGVVDRALERAGSSGWWAISPGERAKILERSAERLEGRRFDLISVMAHEAGKVVGEGDVEVSEAVDLARYYGVQAAGLSLREAVPSPVGTVVVVPPWNFPLAIPIGGVLAALAAGNSVILKPSRQSPRTAALGVECLWGAGVPTDALQVFVADEVAGRRLVSDPGVGAVVLTGSYSTARSFLEWRPGMRLLAETSGKNAIVVTQAADLDQAVADVVQSAFGHAGQKCSAASLVILEREVVKDGRFLRRLADATRTLRVGPAADPESEVGPLIRPARGNLLRALKKLDRGESWLVRPHKLGPQMWTPGIRTGVAAGSWFHQTECFGPVLGVMVAPDLDEALALQNGTPFGLTGGLESLDPDEIRRWLAGVEVGNAYVNRPLTGAVVRRQPFGGWKRSA
ncbi:MAG: proline dehydrogenase family protein, partial [Acidimicrobiales bacterium]